MVNRRAHDAYTAHLMYGSKRAPRIRAIQQVDISQGLIVGYRGREASIPPGFCHRLQNFVPRNDGTYEVRPPFFIGPAFDHENFDEDSPLSHVVVGTFPDGGILSAFDVGGSTGFGFHRTGFERVAIASAADSYSQYGNAAHWGNQSIVPRVRIRTDTGEASIRVHAVTYNSDFTLSQNSVNLTSLFNHQPYVYEDVDVPTARYGRSFALTWKGRGFVLGGTGISYSAPLNPGDFAVANGGGFIPLDTSAPITGAFLLQDIMYICTEAELFVFQYETDPGRDRQIRVLARMQCLGALESDNVGYIAVAQGLYRISGNQVVPTFIPSDQNYYNQNLSGDTGGSVYPLDTDSVFIPRICGLHKFGDVIVLAGLGFNADRRFGDPSGDVYRYAGFSTSTETWAEWTGSHHFDGGFFSPVNALAVYQGPLTPEYGFPVSHIFQFFQSDKPAPEDIPSQAFTNINRTNEVRTMIRNNSSVPAEPILVDVPPFVDVCMDILYPGTEDEVFAANVEISEGYEVFLMTGRIPFGEPFTWKRIHRYWLEANLYGAGALGENSFMLWQFYTPHTESEDFSEIVHDRFERWLENTDSMRNQTPGHLESITDPDNPVAIAGVPQAQARFTSCQLALYWRSPLAFETFPPTATEDFESDADFLEEGVNATSEHSTEEANGGSGSALIVPTDPRPERWTEIIPIEGNTPYEAVWRVFAREELEIRTQFRWYQGEDFVGQTSEKVQNIPADTWTEVPYGALSPPNVDGVRAVIKGDTHIVSPHVSAANSFARNESHTSISMSIPGDEQVGDMVLLFMSKFVLDSPPAPTSGSGNPWTLIHSPGPSTARLWVYGKILEAGDVGANVGWNTENDLAAVGITLSKNARLTSRKKAHLHNPDVTTNIVNTPGLDPVSEGFHLDNEIRVGAGWPRGFDSHPVGFNNKSGWAKFIDRNSSPDGSNGTVLGVFARISSSNTPKPAITFTTTKNVHPSIGLTLHFEKALPLPFFVDDFEIGIPASVTTFDPDTPKWAESGVGRVFVDVTEYKPSQRGI